MSKRTISFIAAAADDNAEANTNAEEDSAAETNAAESAAESAETSSAEEATSVAGMSITLPEIDTFFSDIDGKTLDELKAYMDEKFPNTQYEESINAYMTGGEQADIYYWHFPEGLDVEGEKFDYIAVTLLSNKIYNASFTKEDSGEINEAAGIPDSEITFMNKSREYGYEYTFDYDIQAGYYPMNCGRVFIDTAPSGSLMISHNYAQQEIDSNE